MNRLFSNTTVLSICFNAVSAELLPELKADGQMLQVGRILDDGAIACPRSVIRNICALQEQHDLDLVDDFDFRYAKAAPS